MHRRTRRLLPDCIAILALLASLVFLAGCAAEDEDGGVDGDVTDFDIPSTANLDGVAYADNVSNEGRTDLQPAVGDSAFVAGGVGATRFVAYYSFDLSAIPDGAVVVSATLSLYVRDTQGDPQDMMVLARVDHVDYGAVFPDAPFDATALDLDFAQIADLATVGRRDVDVTDQVQLDLDDGATRSQFGIRGAVATDNDAVTDIFMLTDAEDTFGTGELPMLYVEIE